MPLALGRLALPIACLAGLLVAPARADFELRDGDTVVFVGDSITAEKTYGKMVENDTLLRFPDRHVRLLNVGIGGDSRRLARRPACPRVDTASVTTNGWEPGGPWKAEAWLLRQLTDARTEVVDAGRNLGKSLPDRPDLAAVHTQSAASARRIEDDQRALVQPRPFHFVVSPHVEPPKQP